MPTRTITDHEVKAFRRFYTLLPRTNDPTLLVLKVHLLIEEQLRQLVDERVAKPEAVSEARLDCFQVVCLCEAFCAYETGPKLWNALRKLNKLRNDLAHTLEPTGVQDRMKNIASLMGLTPEGLRTTELKEEAGPHDAFSFASSLLFSAVAALIKKPSAAILELVANDHQAL